METTTTLRVRQSDKDSTLAAAQLRKFRAGAYLGDGMSHGSGVWTWTRVRVVANDTRSNVIVVRFPDGEYSAGPWDEFDNLYVDWAKVANRPAEPYNGANWAA